MIESTTTTVETRMATTGKEFPVRSRKGTDLSTDEPRVSGVREGLAIVKLWLRGDTEIDADKQSSVKCPTVW